MSRGQKPRRPEFYPHMRYRGRKRHARNLRIVFWDADWRAVWPQPDPSSWALGVRLTGLHDLDDVAAELGINLDEPDETDTTEAQFDAMWAEGEAA